MDSDTSSDTSTSMSGGQEVADLVCGQQAFENFKTPEIESPIPLL